MHTRACLFAEILFATCASLPISAQELAPNAPKDQPVAATGDWVAQYGQGMTASIAEAQKSWPEARARFLAGLPPRHPLFVTLRLKDYTTKATEQVFVAVIRIDDRTKTITGRINSPLLTIHNFRTG